MKDDTDHLYRMLDSLDAKCGALLQLSAVMLAIVTLPFFMQGEPPPVPFQICGLAFLVSAFLSVNTLWFNSNRPVPSFVRFRVWVHNIALGIATVAAAGLLVLLTCRLPFLACWA